MKKHAEFIQKWTLKWWVTDYLIGFTLFTGNIWVQTRHSYWNHPSRIVATMVFKLPTTVFGNFWSWMYRKMHWRSYWRKKYKTWCPKYCQYCIGIEFTKSGIILFYSSIIRAVYGLQNGSRIHTSCFQALRAIYGLYTGWNQACNKKTRI